ncbi:MULTISPECIES: universal stress protein [Sphingomonadaceae]|uniref:universal stress protein n=1 Tax=Sphingomonadales TaxID=204457 RepID=UPI0007700A64|nr:universal stress protein [Sphingobium sp. TKS]AMK22920.1 UspA domain-containing protein [Sphingobium sp. TKS]MCF8706659.1 universal stress protein [Rhizorhapis sp. SPR117]
MSRSSALFPVGVDSQAGTGHVVACLDRSEHAAGVVSHAFAIAQALEAPITLLQVLEAQPAKEIRPDPIEWDLRRHEARRTLGKLAAPPVPAKTIAEVQLAEGATAEEICRFSCGQPDCLLVLGTRGENGARQKGIGGTAHNVLDRAPGSILLVPIAASPAPAPTYRRILVPLDGSSWAESVLPLAVRLAKAAQAELVLAHIVPKPELTETRPLEPRDLELQRNVVERNEETARGYLDRVRTYVAAMGLRVRTISARGDDVRTSLAGLIRSESADLVVLSARGHGGRHHADVPYGSVAAYLMGHSATPMLIVRPSGMPQEPAPLKTIQDTRLPAVGPA